MVTPVASVPAVPARHAAAVALASAGLAQPTPFSAAAPLQAVAVAVAPLASATVTLAAGALAAATAANPLAGAFAAAAPVAGEPAQHTDA